LAVVLKIAFRNTLRQKRRTALTLLTIFGGFTLASISIGWSDGTYGYLINMFTSDRLGQIEVHRKGYLDRPSLYDRIKNYKAVGRTIQGIEGVKSWAPRIYSAGLASLNQKTAGVQLTGIDPDREERTTKFSSKVTEGAFLSESLSHQLLLGKGLAQILGAAVGDEIVFVSQAADGSIANDVYKLRGIVVTGDETTDRLGFYITLGDAQQLLALGNEVHEIIVTVHNLKRVDTITESIRHALDNPNLDVQPWQVFAKSFYEAMKADQRGMWIMLFVIILIVAVGVLNTVLMSVLERRREYGLMKALGTRPGQVVRLVLAELFLIAVGGVILGSGLSAVLNWLLSIRGIAIPTPISYGGVEFSRMYSEINARSFLIPAITVSLSAILVGVAPALKAARTEPAKAMRTF
jgi:putative ABC transport system permease protein